MKAASFVIPLNPLAPPLVSYSDRGEGDYEIMVFTAKKVILQHYTFNL